MLPGDTFRCACVASCMYVMAIMMIHTVCKISLFGLLIFYRAIDNVNTAHFRGAVIMVRPKVGGAPKEVS